jgi:hypothetical protein
MNRVRVLAACAVLATVCLALPGAAQARVFFGFGYAPVFIAPAFVYPVPVYAPPVYAAPVYAPPVYAPPAAYAAPAPGAPGTTCYAGRYVCPLDVVHPINDSCSCPTEGNGREAGTVR